MIAYASCTGSSTNKSAIEAAGWRWVLSPFDARDGYTPYALDNGAWTCHRQQLSFDHSRFLRLVEKYGASADFIVVPDIVAGGEESLNLSLSYLARLRGVAPLLLAVQNGITKEDVLPYLGASVGIFIGGDTEYKLSTGNYWGEVAREQQCYLHVGRVNSVQRIHWCDAIGANSFDGTSVSRYSKTIRKLSESMQQPSIIRRMRER